MIALEIKNYDVLDQKIALKLSGIFKVLSDPTRINILNILKHGDNSVTEIALKLNMTHSAISHQLRILKDKNLVKYNKKGKEVFYAFADHHVLSIYNQALEHIQHT